MVHGLRNAPLVDPAWNLGDGRRTRSSWKSSGAKSESGIADFIPERCDAGFGDNELRVHLTSVDCAQYVRVDVP